MAALKVVRASAGNSRISVIAVLAMLSITCSFGGLVPGTSTGLTGPIIAMLPASSVDEKGQAMDPKFTFDPSAPQIAMVVQVGKLSSPASMTITWVQVTDQGDQKLFVDTIPVAANDRAFSIAKNPGTLAAGDYKVIATLGNQTREADLAVAGTQSESTSASTSQTQKGQPPVSGGSGTIPAPANAANNPGASASSAYSGDLCIGGGDEEGCGTSLVDSTAKDVEVYVFNSTGAYPVTVTYSGLFDIATAGTVPALSSDRVPIDPCSVMNPSDLPGAQFQVFAGDGHGHSVSTDFTLGRDSSRPGVDSQFDPEPNQKKELKIGETIKVTITGDENTRPGGSWQSGLKHIEVKGPEGDIGKPWDNPKSKEDQACDQHRTYTYHASYTITKATPNPFTLCPIVRDYAGNENSDPFYCGKFHIGQHWTGTMHTETHQGVDDPLHGNPSKSGTWESALDLSVDGQGKITGSGEAKLTSGCEPWPWQTDPQATGIKFDVTGMAYKDRLELHLNFVGLEGGTVNCGFGAGFFRGQPLVIPITGSTTAQGPVTGSETISVVNHFSSEGTVDLKCDNCAPGVGMEIPAGSLALMMPGQEFGGR